MSGVSASPILAGVCIPIRVSGNAVPRTIAYSALPNPYSNEQAAALDWRATDDGSALLVCRMTSPKRQQGFLAIGWDDGAAVWVNDKLVCDRRAYPKRGHGMLYKDRYLFEERVSVVVPKGESRLAVTSINSRENWGFHIRFADAEGLPLEGLSFSLPESGK